MSSDDLIHNSALAFYHRNHAQHLRGRKKLIERCSDHISDTYGPPALRAEDVALRAFGEFEAKGEKCYIDIDRSTAHGVFVHDPVTGIRRYFTVGDLVALVRVPGQESRAAA